MFKTLWGNNGDIISLHYAGHISDMKGDLMLERTDSVDRFNSVCKIFSGNIFQEDYKNHCIKLLLQQEYQTINENDMHDYELNTHRIRFSDKEEIDISINSWNVNGSKYIKENMDLSKWLTPNKEIKSPDIFLFGFQEICDLNVGNIVFNSNAKNVELWKTLLIFNLNQIDK